MLKLSGWRKNQNLQNLLSESMLQSQARSLVSIENLELGDEIPKLEGELFLNKQ